MSNIVKSKIYDLLLYQTQQLFVRVDIKTRTEHKNPPLHAGDIVFEVEPWLKLLKSIFKKKSKENK